MVWHVDYRGSEVNERVRQGRSHPKEEHVVQQPFSSFSHLKIQRKHALSIHSYALMLLAF